MELTVLFVNFGFCSTFIASPTYTLEICLIFSCLFFSFFEYCSSVRSVNLFILLVELRHPNLIMRFPRNNCQTSFSYPSSNCTQTLVSLAFPSQFYNSYCGDIHKFSNSCTLWFKIN